MKLPLKPSSKIGKCSVWLQIIFLVVLAVALLLVFGIKVLSFDQGPTFSMLGETSLTWWDPTSFVLSILGHAAFITGIIALVKNKDRSLSVFLSVFIGLCTILFILLHSLFISD
jgi:amino acid transporter